MYKLEMVGFVYEDHSDVTWLISSYVPPGRLGFYRGVLFHLTDKT
jgi:hypothetical protein